MPVKSKTHVPDMAHHFRSVTAGKSIVIAATKDTVRDSSDISVDLRSLLMCGVLFYVSELYGYGYSSEIKNTYHNHPIPPLMKLFWKEGLLPFQTTKWKREDTPQQEH
jgi:hypothetical protein